MVVAVDAADTARQLALLRAHPDLAGKAARAGALTAHSTAEQAGAGLDRLSDAEYARFHALNDAYQKTFGFPFIIAVKGHTRETILAAFAERLENSEAMERTTALAQVARIARIRLDAMLARKRRASAPIQTNDSPCAGATRCFVFRIRFPL